MVLGCQRGPRGEPRLGIIRNTPGNALLALGSRSESSRGVQRPKLSINLPNSARILISARQPIWPISINPAPHCSTGFYQYIYLLVYISFLKISKLLQFTLVYISMILPPQAEIFRISKQKYMFFIAKINVNHHFSDQKYQNFRLRHSSALRIL